MGGKLWPDIGVGLTALPPLREMAARPQYGANAASVAMVLIVWRRSWCMRWADMPLSAAGSANGG